MELKLGDVVNYADNTTVQPDAMQEDAWLLELEDIERDSSRILAYETVGKRKPQSAKNSFHAGDVLYGKLRPYLNKVVRADRNGYSSSEIIAIKPNQLDGGYLFHYLKSPCFRDYVQAVTHGVRMPRLGTEQAKTAPFLLPPLAEQKRIAQKLDALLAQVDNLKARIHAIPALLKRFRESALSAAVSGRLTQSREKSRPPAEPRRLNDRAQPASAEEISQAIEVTGEPFPDQWTVYALEQIVDGERGIPYGIVQTGDPVVEGVSTVRCGDVRHLRIDTTALKIVARDIEKNYARTRLKGGEVLLAIRGSVGNTAVAPKSLANCNISREVAMIPCIDDVDSTFVALVLQSKRGQQLLAGKTRGVAQKGINLADVRRLLIALPSRSAQSEIVRRVEQLFAYADQLEAKVAAAQQRIDALTQSLLAKAFRGELVPQDPTDEPASVLLERIRTQRAATPKPKRGRKAATS
ncbi:restriction endonuclease subunit S [Xanthomonas arboricola]|uniref:restriction endonuclease subunit S n=1 Tax=Xanthomonas arboricola TaxID=56448 RepID=UPI00169449A6|nr:restriction endonuclease subunit S [Xanthomonas arboricola]NJB92488.1 type I restriction enzyme S subunit [Xanthomonas arboricola]